MSKVSNWAIYHPYGFAFIIAIILRIAITLYLLPGYFDNQNVMSWIDTGIGIFCIILYFAIANILKSMQDEDNG